MRNKEQIIRKAQDIAQYDRIDAKELEIKNLVFSQQQEYAVAFAKWIFFNCIKINATDYLYKLNNRPYTIEGLNVVFYNEEFLSKR